MPNVLTTFFSIRSHTLIQFAILTLHVLNIHVIVLKDTDFSILLLINLDKLYVCYQNISNPLTI